MAQPSFLSPLLTSPALPVHLVRAIDGKVVADRVEAAFESATRRRGLLGRDGLAPGAALIIAPCNAVHTFFMRFPIDVVFVARGGAVVKIAHDVAAWRMRAAPTAYATIEFAAGAAAKAGLAVGDTLSLRPAGASIGS